MTRTVDLQSDAHRRHNPLTGEWVLVSPHRTARPWQGQLEPPLTPRTVAYDPQCYLCPGNARAGGRINPAYTSTFVFDNDFPALLPDTPWVQSSGDELLLAEGESGRCRVMCYSPLHNVSLGEMEVPQIREVVDTWAAEFRALGRDPDVNAVTIFENRGAMMGCSNPHPHGQIWANRTLPNELRKESAAQGQYLSKQSRCLLCDYWALEIRHQERLVSENSHFIAVVPFWATWPFETLILPRAHVSAVDELSPAHRNAFAQILKDTILRYDALFDVSFPYTMGLHQQPTDGKGHPEWHLHTHFYPPLLRSATVRKFMVGYEMLAGPQRDITPETAAAWLRKRTNDRGA
jgi:UDPglucose--hexose-1-phosphate uridylyltransferase